MATSFAMPSRLFCVGLVLWVGGIPAAQATLSPDQQALLAELDSNQIESVLAIVGQAQQWKSQVDAVRAGAQQIAEGQPGPMVAIVREIVETTRPMHASWSTSSGLLRGLVARINQLESVIQEAERRIVSTPFVEEEWPDSTPEEFRKELANKVYAELDAQLLQVVDQEILAGIAAAKDPAEYAKNFIQGELEKWFSEPRTHEVLNGLKFTIEPPGQGVSVFDPQGGLQVRIDYPAIPGARVVAKGLYFEYVEGQVPKPNVDNLQVDGDWKGTVAGKLTALGSDLPSDLGLPIKVSNLRLLGFNEPAPDGSRGGMQFDMEIELAGGSLPAIKGKDIVILPYDNQVRWSNLSTKVPATPPYPLGTTGLAMYGYEVAFDPKSSDRSVGFGTHISTVASTPEMIDLHVDVNVPLPIREIRFQGDAILAQTVNVARIEGSFDFTKPIVSGKFQMPAPGSALPIGKFLQQTGEFTASKEGLFAKGEVKLFEQSIERGELQILPDGSATLQAYAGFELLKQELASRLSAQIDKGFERVRAEFVCDAQVDVGFIRAMDVTIKVSADSEGAPMPIHVELQAWGVETSFHLPTLTALDLATIVRELQKQLPDIYDRVAEALAQSEAAGRKWASEQESKFKEWTYENASKYGLDRISTGNAAIDEKLGVLAEEGKKAGKAASDARERAGKFATALREKPLDTALGAIGSVGGDLADGLGTILGGGGGGLFGGDDDEPEGPSPTEIAAEKRKNFAEGFILARFQEMVAATEGIEVLRDDQPETYAGVGKRVIETDHLQLGFNSVIATRLNDDPHDAVLSLLVASNGYRVGSGGKAGQQRQQIASGVANAYVEFIGVVPEVVDAANAPPYEPKAKIHVPAIKEESTYNGRAITYEELQKLVERYFPEVEIDGTKALYEKNLVLKNDTDENVVAWVQVEKRGVNPQSRQFVWGWVPFRGEERSIRVDLKPGESVRVRYPDFDAIGRGSPPRMGGELDKVLQKALQKSQGNKEPDEVYGRRVRVWGESESGRKWTRYRERGRWMLEPVKSGERKYFGKEREDFVHAFKRSDEPRTWKERYVQVANRTGKTIVVRAEAYTRNLEEGQRWVSAAEVRLAPGKKTSLKTEGGTQLRGSKLRIWATDADDEYFRWTEHKRRAIEVVAPEGYRREEIGDYLFVFDRVGRDEPGDR